MKKIFIAMIILLCSSSLLFAAEISGDIASDDIALSYYKEGANFYRNGQYIDAKNIWEKAVDLGNVGAMVMTGKLYEDGHGVEQNTGKALEYYQKALDMGFIFAKLHIAILYINGIPPITKDASKAYEYLKAVEDLDYELIPQVAYKFYLYGWGTPINYDKSKEFASKIKSSEEKNKAFEEIAKQEKQQERATKIASYNTPTPLFVQGEKLFYAGKYTDAMITFKKAVEDGDGRAARYIGLMYENGVKGIAKNLDNALKWYLKSQELYYPGANIDLAFLYLNGLSVEKNLEKAYSLIHEVEDIDMDNDNIIPLNAFKFYLNGWGTTVNFKKAAEIASRIHDEKTKKQALALIAEKEDYYGAISVYDFLTQANQNKAKFNKVYHGKRITLIGLVDKIISSGRNYELKLYGEKRANVFDITEYVECRFSASEVNSLADINPRDKVKITGTYVNDTYFSMAAITLTDCIVEKVWEAKSEKQRKPGTVMVDLNTGTIVK